MLTRRHFIQTTTALFAAAAPGSLLAASRPSASQKARWDAAVTPAGYDPATSNPWGLNPRFLPRRVEANAGLVPGDIHVDAIARYLYHIEEGGTAMRYGVAIGRGGLYEPGTYTIRRKLEWPSWTPTPGMLRREPQKYGPLRNGMPGGLSNPLGARALYLFQPGRGDTFLRVHGTNDPSTIGRAVSNGCARLVNDQIVQFYDKVPLDTRVILYPAT